VSEGEGEGEVEVKVAILAQNFRGDIRHFKVIGLSQFDASFRDKEITNSW